MKTMRRGFSWALLATCGLTGVALWVDGDPSGIVRAVDPTSGRIAPARSPYGAMPRAPAGVTATAAPSSAPPLPRILEFVRIETARRDIFAPSELSAVAATPPAAAAPVQPAPVRPAPVGPAAPALAWRYLGSMITPLGNRLVLLANGDATATVEPGTQLDGGYVVQAVGRDAVRLVYPPLATVVDLPIPADAPTAP